MSLNLSMYVLTPAGRKKFEDWRDELGITDGTYFKVMEYLYNTGSGNIPQIVSDTRLPHADVVAEVAQFEQDGYVRSYNV